MNCQQAVSGPIVNDQKLGMRESHASEKVNNSSFGKGASGTSI
jgi:hypothetical protein